MIYGEQPRILYNYPHQWALTHCACAVDGAVYPSSASQNWGGRWRQASGLHRKQLSREHELFFNPFGAAGVVVLNRSARKIFQAFRNPRPLFAPHERELAQLSLLEPLDQAHADSFPTLARPTVLTAWLHVTNACNLRCTYCFVRKSDEVMSEETGKAAVEAVFRSAQKEGFRAVKLKYAGGEATLNFALIRSLHHHALALSRDVGIQLQEVVLSNGVALTRHMLDFIRENGIILSISLDGLNGGHDQQRSFFNGRGSAHLVRKGVERALAHGVSPHLSITVTQNNIDHLTDVVTFALEKELYFNLNLYQEHDPTRSHNELRADNERLIEGIMRALAIIEAHLPPYNVFTALMDRSNFAGPHERSCGAGDSYLVIDHLGRVARCQMEMERPVSHIHAAHPLADIRLYEPKEGEPHFLAVDAKAECRSCQWRYWCGGGCSLMSHRLYGRSDVKSPYCEVYQALFPEILRIEGLRLLKFYDVTALKIDDKTIRR